MSSSLLARFSSVRGSGSVAGATVVPESIAKRVQGDIVAAPIPAGLSRPSVEPVDDRELTITTQPVQTIRVDSVETIERLRPVADANTTGAAIRKGQQQNSAAAEGFASVNREWYKKTLTYDQARDVIASDRGLCEDILAPRKRFSPIVNSSGQFVVRDGETGRDYVPTENALCQLAGWCDTGLTLPKRLISGDEQDRETLRMILENGWRKVAEDKNLLIRLKGDGTIRAVLSDQYAKVDNEWFLNVLESVIPGGRVSHFRGDGDAVFFNVLIPDSLREDGDSSYGAMLACGNSEIGTRKVATLPSVFRWICYNGCIWDQVEGVAYVRKVHRGELDLPTLAAEIRENLNRQIPLVATGIDKLLALRSVEVKGLPDIAVVGTVLQQIGAGITRPMAARVLDGYRDQRTAGDGIISAFDIVNGLTKAAQEFAPGVQETVERAAGELMAVWDGGRWDAAFKAARSWNDKAAKSVFPLDVAAV